MIPLPELAVSTDHGVAGGAAGMMEALVCHPLGMLSGRCPQHLVLIKPARYN